MSHVLISLSRGDDLFVPGEGSLQARDGRRIQVGFARQVEPRHLVVRYPSPGYEPASVTCREVKLRAKRKPKTRAQEV